MSSNNRPAKRYSQSRPASRGNVSTNKRRLTLCGDHELATTSEAAKYLRTTVGRLANDRYQGHGPQYVKYGRTVLYRWADLRTFVEKNTFPQS